MEEQLGVLLFDRTPDGFVLTAAGEELREVAERVEDEVLSLEGSLVGRDARLRGELHVSTMDIIFRGFRPLFKSFIEGYPDVELSVTTTITQVSLSRREADVAIRLSNGPSEYLVGRRVGRMQFAVYAHEDLVERAGPNATYSDFPWIHWSERDNARWLDGWLSEFAPRATVAMRTNMEGSVVLREAILAGIGVHFLPCFDGDSEPSLRRIGGIEEDFARDLWLLTMPDLRNNSRVHAFMEHMDAAFRERADELEGRPS
jgi:DNA-binding transcriptional LysR family regulator